MLFRLFLNILCCCCFGIKCSNYLVVVMAGVDWSSFVHDRIEAIHFVCRVVDCCGEKIRTNKL